VFPTFFSLTFSGSVANIFSSTFFESVTNIFSRQHFSKVLPTLHTSLEILSLSTSVLIYQYYSKDC
jgi:predicted nucleic acid-binding protein